MQLGLDEAIKYLESDSILTEFYPYINDSEDICVPETELSGVLCGFEDVRYDRTEKEGVNEADVLSRKDYIEELDEFIEDINSRGRYQVEIVVSKEELYRKYVNAVDRFDIYGVVNLEETSNSSSLVLLDTIPEFTPPEGEHIPVDFGTYTKSLSFLMPNIIQDVSVTTKMYDKYLKISEFNIENAVSNRFIIESKDANDCVNELNLILEDYRITPEDIIGVMTDEVPESILVEYYKEMMIEYDMSENQSRGLLLHSLKRTVAKCYLRNEISEYQETNQRLLVSLEEDVNDLPYKNSMI